MITNKNCRFPKGGGNYLRLLIAALISFGAVAAWAQEPVPGEDHSTITTYEDENILSSDLSLRRLNVNGNSVYIFTNAASAQVVKAKRGIVLVDCLLVGGGGGGGCSRGGGGGGGGVTNATDIVGAYIDRDDTFTLAVGVGGAGCTSITSKGSNGGASSLEFGLFSASVAGGGGGGSWNSIGGAAGASGGGGAQNGAGGAGIDGMGFAGANGSEGNSAASGGGGGAGHAGYAADKTTKVAGNGGEGIASSITGTEVYYGGGGGGGGGAKDLWGGYAYDPGSGGAGGGGNGGKDTEGANGVDGLGGGGGGGGADGVRVDVTDKAGGNGGSGIAVLVLRPLAYEIVPIPDQVHESFDPCRPEFVVSNRLTGAAWRVGGDIVSEYFDVEYENNIGVGTAKVIITGKGEYAEANYVRCFNITATKYEDANISTTDLTASRLIVDGKSVYVFTNAAAAQVVTAKRGINLTDFLVVGGGGGGGCTMAGGGGAGGVTNATGIVRAYVDMNDTFTLAVGAGGAGSESVSVRGDNGGDTTLAFGIVNVRAYGGGGGGSRSGPSGLTGSSGGSGGGGAPNAAGGAGVDGQGFAGATGGGSNSGKSGGGGGAGHAGYVNVDGHSGYGGEGVTNDITGVEVVYGGGGGGGGAHQSLFWKNDPGLGGLGGGGDGGKDTEGANGVDGLGGGGGGGGAGYGGSGVAIVDKHGGRGGAGTVIFAVEPADFEIESIAEQYLEVGTGGCTPEPVVRTSDGLTLLTKDTDYTVSYTDNTKSGNAVITITGINYYAGKSCEIGFTIYRRYYVDSAATSEGDGSQASPFATIAYAITQANAAIAGGDRQVIIHAEDGTYPENGLSVSNPIVIEGNASDRTAVKIGKTGGRVFLVENADAMLRNLTVQNGQSQATEAYATAGGNIRLNAGMVTNCVVTGATVNGNDKAGANLFVTGGTVIDCLIDGSTGARNSKGQGVYMKNGHVVRCRIVNQIAGTDTGAPTLGVGVYMTGGLVENCLIAGNAAGNATLYMTGGTAVNCTIAGNTPRVADKCVGVNVANDAASVVNCVVFGNGGTALAEWANNSRGARFFSCASSVEITGGNDCVTLQSSSYLSYFEDNVSWVPFAGSPMMDAGDGSRYFSSYSQTDLLGNARVSPADGSIDIGCYESDQNSFSFVPALVSHPSILSGATVDFAMMAVGAADTVTFEIDFGDGSANLETTESSFTRQFDTAGYFHARARAKVGGGAYGEWVDIIQPIRVVNAVVYVSDADGNDANPGTAAAPLKTVTMALNTLTNLLSKCETDVDGVTIHVAAGTYLENALPKISSAMTIEGVASDRTAVKIGKTGDRIFIVENADAVLRNLTVQNGQSVGAGGNIRLNAGMVTNCVISGATFDTKDRNGGNLYVTGGTVADCLIDGSTGARNTKGHGVYMTGGYVVRCRIVNQVAGYDTGAHSLGVGAYLTGGVIDNCLIAGNTSGIGALYMYGGKAVNCTVAGNTARATNQCIGIYVSASSSSVVNCVAYSNDTNTAKANFGDKNLNRYYYCGSSVTNESCATWTVLEDKDFVSARNGNWHQKRTSKLIDCGTLDTTYRPADSSATDLDGNPRVLNKGIDLGCWEILSNVGFRIIVR